MATIRVNDIIVKAKIDILEPICNCSGVFYYAGFINDTYIHFLGYDRLNKRDIKAKLIKKYIKEGYLIDSEELLEGYYGR